MSASRLAVALFAVVLISSSAFAQNNNGGNNAGNRGNRQRNQNNQNGGNFDPAQAQQRALDRIKTQLGATDDEWKVLQPKIEKLMTAQRDARAGGRGGAAGGRRGNRGGQNNAAQPTPADQSEVAKAMADLRTAVADKATPADDLAKKLAALHEAKAKAAEARTAAQKDLKDVLTARQEAVLVQNGMLD
jgi:hypothetical protein